MKSKKLVLFKKTMEAIKSKDWNSMSELEQRVFDLKCVSFKEEAGGKGPVYMVSNKIAFDADMEEDINISVPVKNGLVCASGGFHACWMARAGAERLAKSLNVPFEE